jgi:hypothetical protein
MDSREMASVDISGRGEVPELKSVTVTRDQNGAGGPKNIYTQLLSGILR